MMHPARVTAGVWLVATLALSCSSEQTAPATPNPGGGGSSGAAASGGSNAVGGASVTGGANSAAGNTSTAGSGGSGGVAGSAGSGGAETEPYPEPAQPPADETGAELWLRYEQVNLPSRLAEYRAAIKQIVAAGDSASLKAAQAELVRGLSGLTGSEIPVVDAASESGAVVLGTPASSAVIQALPLAQRLAAVGDEGYIVESADIAGKAAIVVAANTDVGALHGAFALLRHLQMHRKLVSLSLSSAPRIKRRVLNHWDNMDGSVERGYAGKSLWAWSSLPGTLSERYTDYARANASLGINGAVLNNVNSNAQILSTQNLDKVAALAKVFRPYGISVYLSARFSAPIELGGLNTADPQASNVRQWWVTKANEIYEKIPDFGGFLVKANSEGQPGPQDYNRSHAEGAKMLSDALAPHGGVVMWRAFVYSTSGDDRIRQAYDEFQPLDGAFGSRSFVQVKNGPLDFQPREPFNALFGAMPKTPLALELQITKEYLGEDSHLSYLGTLFEEVLKADTHAKGAGSSVAKVIDGSLHGHGDSAIAGVANIGTDANWSGSHFNQANWYAFGRMAWDPELGAESVADEWIRQTFSNDPIVVQPVTQLMMASREALVNYMTPLGLVHIMGTDHHYGPSPWVNNLTQANWNPFYYHTANASGIGFDRTASGSKAVSQYAAPVASVFGSRSSVPDELLLFFHRVGWDEKLAASGRSLWDELVHRYSSGVDEVAKMRQQWSTVMGRVDAKRYAEVAALLKIQHHEARWWRDACLQYFASVGARSLPAGYAPPAHDLAYYKDLAAKCPSDPTKPRCNDVYTGEPSPAVLP
jgi:alpha-glucuronidase